MEERSRQVEGSIVEVLRLIPDLGRTHLALLLRPRQYFAFLRDHQRLPGTIPPVALWLANVVVVIGLRQILGEGGKLHSWQDVTHRTGLVIGVALLALYLLLTLDLRGDGAYVLVLGVVFSGAVVFIPMFLLSAIPLPTIAPARATQWLVFGMPSPFGWQTWLIAVLQLAALMAWCWILILGISTIFGRSKVSVAISLLSLVALALIGTMACMITMQVIAVRNWAGTQIRAFAPARVALFQVPPDYAAAQAAFDELYASRMRGPANRYVRASGFGMPATGDRSICVGAKIGSAATGRAAMAVLLKQPEAERQFYQSAMQVIAGKNQDAADLLFGAVDELGRDPVFGKVLKTGDTKAMDDIKRMLRDESYLPDVPKDPEEREAGTAIPWPSLFP